MTKSGIIAAINAIVSKYSAWRIGLTHDLTERKAHWRDTEGLDIKYWKDWQADSLSDAQDIESQFINKGMDGGTGGDLSAKKTVYVYIF